MRSRRQGHLRNLFTFLSVFATLVVVIEMILQSLGGSICPTEGCKIVSSHVRFGDYPILVIGLVTFLLLSCCSWKDRRETSQRWGQLIDAVLIVALACEGFLAGYQAFSIHTACLFCLGILAVMAMLGLLRLASGNFAVLTGFGAFAAVFSMLYLVPLPSNSVVIPNEGRLLLFYSKDCKHCSELIQELDRQKIDVKHLLVNEYAAYLKQMGVEHVPTLMVNEPLQKIFLTGKDAILKYLAACAPRPISSEPAVSARKPARRTASKHETPAASTPDLFQPAPVFTLTTATDDPGMCRQDEACK